MRWETLAFKDRGDVEDIEKLCRQQIEEGRGTVEMFGVVGKRKRDKP